MTDTAANRAATALRHRNLAIDAFNAAQAQYEVAVLDHVTARIVEAYPEATHLTFDHSPHDRTIELHGLWTTHRGGTEELVLNVRRDADTTTLDLEELADDLSDALAGLHSATWSAVRPAPGPDRRRTLDLPPADRIAGIAELAHTHHPHAQMITVEFTGDTCRVLDVICADIPMSEGGAIRLIRATDECPLWPASTERRITALARQIHPLPHLRARHLARFGAPDEHTAFLLLPQTGTDIGADSK
ncbi:hypothetical protein AB0958_28160 [Streptomyces sp. NPDC006655]|uniref:hypothetical protein n=1 Tax=Streptomyces sp. NPDC006655 TaxID=3156898 RepID=UPI00345624A2